MSTLRLPPWVSEHYRKSHTQFIDLYKNYAHNNSNNYDALQAEIHNLMVVIKWYLENESDEQAIDLVNDLGSFFLHRGYWGEGIGLLKKTLELAQGLYNQYSNEEKHAFNLASVQLMLISFLFVQGTTSDAASLLQQVLETNELLSNEMITGAFALLAGVVTDKLQGNKEEVSAFYESGLQKIQPSGHLLTISYVTAMIADNLAEQGEYEKALNLYWKKLEIDRQTKDLHSLIDSFRGLGEVARHAGLPEVAEQCFQDAVELAKTQQSPEIQHTTLSDLARSAYQRKDYSTSIRFYEEALTIARQSQNKSAIASTLSFLAFAREESGDEVRNLLEESLSICRELNDYEGMVMAMIQLGDVYERLADFQHATDFYRQAVDIATRVRNLPLIALGWLQLGDVAFGMEDLQGAQHAYEQSLGAHSKYDDPQAKAIVLQRLGQIYLMQNKLHEAHEAIHESASLHTRINDMELYSENLYTLARIAASKNETKEAQSLAQQAAEILRNIDSPHMAEIDDFLNSLDSF